MRSLLLARRTLGPRCGRRRAFGRRGWRALSTLARCRIPDALHVARLADQTGHFGKAAAFDADVGEQRIDQRSLHAVAQRGIDDFVGGAATAASAGPAIEPVHLEDADALDLLHRLDAFAYDAFDPVEQFA